MLRGTLGGRSGGPVRKAIPPCPGAHLWTRKSAILLALKLAFKDARMLESTHPLSPKMSRALLMFAVPIFLSHSVSAGVARAADWPGWRGSGRDGIVEGFRAPGEWPSALKELWKVPVGEGHASPIGIGGQTGVTFVFTREKDEEVLRALSVLKGDLLWRTAYPAPYKVNPEAASHGPGPKSTPLHSKGRVFTLGISGILTAFDVKTGAEAQPDAKPGTIAWQLSFEKEFPSTSPLFGTAMSPVAEGDAVIAHVGGHDKGALRAFDASTGETLWSFAEDGPSYASPVVAELGGERQWVSQTQTRLVGVSLKDGKLLWSVPFTTEYEQNSVTPLISKDLVIYSGYMLPVTALRIGRDGAKWSTTEAWTNPEASQYMSSPVLDAGRIYGMSMKQKGQIFALDGSTGKTLWKGKGRLGESASVLSLGSVLMVLTTEGELSFLKPGDKADEILAKYNVGASPTWATPAVVEGRILVKDKTTLWCYGMK